MRAAHSKQFISLVLVFDLLTSVLPVAAQTRPGTTPKAGLVAVKSEKKPTCQGGWSGVVTYKKTLKDSQESDSPGIRKNTDRIIHKDSRDYDYTARTVVDGTDPQKPVVTSKVNFTDVDLSYGQEKVFDSCHAYEPGGGHWFIIEGNDDRQTQAQASGPARSFNLNVDELAGTYNFSVQLPDAVGRFKREEHTKRTGHCQAKNNEPFDRSTDQAFKIEGEGFSSQQQKMNPDDPDHLSGSRVWGDDGKGQVRTFIHELTWRFTRCPQKLLITELKFEHPKFPNPYAWQKIEDVIGTIDGNRVKVKAKVLNLSAEEKYADLKLVETYRGDRFNGARPDEPLSGAESSFKIEGGEEKEFEFIWDSEGQSWFDDGRPHLNHRFMAELSENGQKKDQKEERFNIAPKPVVLVHGVWSNYDIWEPLYQNLLTENHSYQWKAFPVGDRGEGRMATGAAILSGDPAESVYENADRLAKYVGVVQKESNAWHVDMVAHSTGGLVARLFLQKQPAIPDARPLVKHLVMLGTPNNGIPCVDIWVGKLGVFKEKLQPLNDYTQENIDRFNKYVVNTGGTKISALAGNPVPLVCGGLEWNDGFVTVKSAKYGVSDTGESNDLNLQLVDGKNFGNFVKPHLVTGPKGTYPYPVKNDPTDWRRWQTENHGWVEFNGSYSGDMGETQARAGLVEIFLDDAANPRAFGPNPIAAGQPPVVIDQSFSTGLKVGAKQVVDVDIPVQAADNLGVTFLTHPGVTVSLVDPSGKSVSRNPANSVAAQTMFRMLLTQRPVTPSTWKLRVENTTNVEQSFAAFTWSIEGLAAAARQ